VEVGKNVRICSSARFYGIGNLVLGDDVWVGPGCEIEASGVATVKIGSHVDIANGVMITTGTHEIDLSGEHIAGAGRNDDISIGDGCWLGLGAKILPGAEVPARSVVAAGSVVVGKFVDSLVLIAGVPAKVKKHYRLVNE